jgi:hypothetical protein
MIISIDGRELQTRPWGDDKTLLFTRDEGIKDAILRLREDHPAGVRLVELLTDPDMEPAPEDWKDTLMAVVDREACAVLINLSEEKIELAAYEEETDDGNL